MKKTKFHRRFKRSLTGTLIAIVGSLVLGGFMPSATAQTNTYKLEPAWVLPPIAPYDWVSTNDRHRGLAYNGVTGNLLTTSRFPETNAAVYVLDSANGQLIRALSVKDVKKDINFPINKVKVAADGAIFACSLAVSSTNPIAGGNNGPFRIYRWASETADPTLVYEGDPSAGDLDPTNQRYGDSMAVRGAGLTTEILVGTRGGTKVALFRTSDGVAFTPLLITAPELQVGSAMQSIDWGEADTFYTKADGAALTAQRPLQHFSLDTNSALALLMDPQQNLAPRLGGPFAFDPARNLLAMIKVYTIGGYPTHQVRLFKKTTLGLDQQDVPLAYRPYATTNANNNGVGDVAFGGGKLFTLDCNNGIMAFNIKETPITTQIFWAEDGGFPEPEKGSVWRVNADGTGKVLIADKLNRSIGVDVDSVNGYVYWSEDGWQDGNPSYPSRIVRARLDGSERTTLFSEVDHGFTSAQMLQLDVANGYVYWTDYFKGVIRGKLDGTGYTVMGGVPTSVQYTAIDLDLANGQIYFNDPTQMGVLCRMDYSGANKVELARNISIIDSWHFNTVSLDMGNNNIYYADAGTHEIKRMDLDGTNPTLVLLDNVAIPFGVAHGPGNMLYWLTRAQRIATAFIDGQNYVSSIGVELGTTPFGLALHSVPVPELAIKNISVAGTVVTITWENGKGPFQLQRRASLTTGQWDNVGSTTTERQATDTATAGPMFYRISE